MSPYSCEVKKMAEKIIRCPIHNYIRINDIERELIDTQLFQRLRNIHHQGTAFYTYPGATHSRFEHSLGVMHLSGRMCTTLIQKNKEHFDTDPSKLISLLRLIGLFHDIAHGPFSHVSDKILDMNLKEEEQRELDSILRDKAAHEYITYKIMRDYLPKYLERINGIKGKDYEYLSENAFRVFIGDYINEVVDGKKMPKEYGIGLKKIIDSKIDCDKMDFLLRDSYIIGFGYSNLDINRLIRGFGIDPTNNELLFDRQALSSLEDLIIKRYQEYRWVNFHHTVCFTDEIMSRILELGVSINFFDKNLFTLNHFKQICEYDLDYFGKSTPIMIPEILDDRFILTNIRKNLEKTREMHVLKTYANILEKRQFYKSLWKVNTIYADEEIYILKNLFEKLFEEYKNKTPLYESLRHKIEKRIMDEKKLENVIITFKPYRPITISPSKSVAINTIYGPKPIHEISYIINNIISAEYLGNPPLYMPIYIFITKDDFKKFDINNLKQGALKIIQDEIEIE